MILLAGFILKGPLQAALVAAAMAILGLLVPPVTWISAAAIVLVTLVNGFRQGLITTAIAFVGASVFAYIIFANMGAGEEVSPIATIEIMLYLVLLVWLPAWIVATTLQQTVSLAFALQLLGGISLAAVMVIYLLYPDFGEIWRGFFDDLSSQLASQTDSDTMAALRAMEEGLIQLLPGLFVSSLMFGTMLSLFLGRWWQAVYFNPGGFAREFQALSLGKTSSMIAILIVVSSMLLKSYVLYSLLVIVMMLYLIQGTAIMHAVFRIRKLHYAWLITLYLLMLFIPQVMMLVAIAGLTDSWLNIRQRLTPVNSQ